MFYVIDDFHRAPSYLYAYRSLSPHRDGGGQESDSHYDAARSPWMSSGAMM